VVATPRIEYSELPPGLQERLRAKVERLGYLGEFFQVAANQPGALAHFIDFTEDLKAALTPDLVEAIALSVAAATGNAYERVQHERLALKLGFERGWVEGLVAGETGGERFSPEQSAAAALAREVVAARGASCAEGFERLQELAGPAVAVACLMTAVRYLAHATMANTWGLRPPVDSPLGPDAEHV
jgi:alkylhydroperoxidase family enzyme